MSIVLILIGIVVGGSITISTASLHNRQIEDTHDKLQAIQTALYNYRVAFNRLPCPADLTLVLADPTTGLPDQYFGVEGANPGWAASSPGNCYGGTPHASRWDNISATESAATGMVPTQTLRLPDDYAFDGWGRRFRYVIDTAFTAPGAFTTIPFLDSAGVRMYVMNTISVPRTNLTSTAAYTITSFGPDGHGAFPRNGGNTTISAGTDTNPVVNADTLKNCNCSATTGAQNTFDSVFIQRAPTTDPNNRLDNFDDVVVYATRATLALPSEQ